MLKLDFRLPTTRSVDWKTCRDARGLLELDGIQYGAIERRSERCHHYGAGRYRWHLLGRDNAISAQRALRPVRFVAVSAGRGRRL